MDQQKNYHFHSEWIWKDFSTPKYEDFQNVLLNPQLLKYQKTIYLPKSKDINLQFWQNRTNT